ncbi:DUF1854 domain-containing protein [Paenibacillus thermotolerans]|uniref:DUF1854 domain-containing protein n=1 Tax=Paenibacillus thermotolerans TaxID=3027807 RepID=UPI0023677ACA|nr:MULTISPECIES: DUF1854 domain-containing protein [unclassified Paenibacillus]
MQHIEELELTETNEEKGASGRTDLSEAAKLLYLNRENAVFTKTKGNMLSVTVNGEEHPVVYLHCSFPHTNKRIYISVRTQENKEIGIIKSLDDDFPSDVASLLEEQIHIRYFAPIITKVNMIKEEFGYSYWDAETSAGHCQFTVRSGGGNVKLVTDRRLLISDVDGNRFIIENLDRLSEKEYRMVEMCI